METKTNDKEYEEKLQIFISASADLAKCISEKQYNETTKSEQEFYSEYMQYLNWCHNKNITETK